MKLATQGADLDRYTSLAAGITDAAAVENEFEAIMPPTIHVLAKGSTAVLKFMRLYLPTNSKVLATRRGDLVGLLQRKWTPMRTPQHTAMRPSSLRWR